MNSGLTNLHRALRIARLALVSDEAYRAALDSERERAFEETRREQARIVDQFISISNGDLSKRPRAARFE